MLRRSIDVSTDSSNRAVACLEFCDPEVRNLDYTLIGRQQKVLRFDVAVNHVALMRVSESGANLLQIIHRLFQPERLASSARRQITTAEKLQYQVVKSHSVQIDRRPMPQAANDVRVSNSIQRDRFVLKILDQGLFQILVLITAQQHV